MSKHNLKVHRFVVCQTFCFFFRAALKRLQGLVYKQLLDTSNCNHNETGLTMQSAGPIRQPWQPITFEFLFKDSEFGHWKVKGGQDAFAFRHPSLGKTEVFSLLASDAHHHKVSPTHRHG